MLHKNKENSEKKQNSETIFHSNRSWQVSRQLLKPKIPNYFNLILDIFYKNWCYPNCKHCIATVFWTITVIVPLQKFREKLSKGAITNDHSKGSTSPSRLSTNVTITEKLKNPKFSQQKKLRYSLETELINNFDKSHDSVLIAKIQHFVSITNINTNNVMALWAHPAGVLLNHAIKTRTKIAYECKAKRKLKRTTHKVF